MKPTILSVLVALCQQCPDLLPGSYVQLTSVNAIVGGSVTVSCDTGYKLNQSQQLTKNLTCEGTSTWSASLPSCTKKRCPSISASPNMTILEYSRFINDTATIECDMGLAFDLNLTQPVTQRVTSSLHVTCLDDSSSTNGSWSPAIGTCSSEIYCPEPPLLEYADLNYSSVALGSFATYRFHSGYQSNGLFSHNLTCIASAAWASINGSCTERGNGVLGYGCTVSSKLLGYGCTVSKQRSSLGCFNLSCITAVNSSTTNGGDVNDCLQFCQDNMNRFAAVSNGTCYCMDDSPSCTAESAEVCNDYCRQYDPSSNPSSSPIYCGSATGQASVYYTYEGCLQGVNTSNGFQEEVYGHIQLTCRERCRARESGYASTVYSMCYCFNTTDLAGSFYGSCDGKYLDINDLGKYTALGATCLDLYDKQIRMAGVYYMTTPLRKEQCYFKDGTQCEFGWVGYSGHCYLSVEEPLLNFNDAKKFCHENDSELVSILDQDEQAFISSYRAKFQGLEANLTNVYYWLGMGDGTGSSVFMWLDGSMMTYSTFSRDTPKMPNYQCAVEHQLGWMDDDCGQKRSFMCKKLAGWSSCIRLASLPVDRYERTHVNMSLTFCIELCKGQSFEYALVQNTTCLCTNITDLASTILNATECTMSCPGQMYQTCGGENETYTYTKAAGRASAGSCEELQLFGLPDADYEIDSTDVSIQHCEAPSCPYGWLSVGSHCYKAHLTVKKWALSVDSYCAKDNAYPVSIETTEESEQLMGLLKTIALYAGQSMWRIGLSALSMHGGLHRWASGKQVKSNLWSNNGPSNQLYVTASTATTWHRYPDVDLVFVCEKGQDYVGCFASVSANTGASITSYYKMTIQLCVERCRAEGMPYAYLTVNDCYCWTNLTDPVPGPCLHKCSGQPNELCGGVGDMMSVYAVSEYPEIATACEDLSEAGIFLSGDYIVNGSLTYCHLIDGTECDSGWFGYNGNCYKHFPAEPARTRAVVCRDNNATQVSLFGMDEWNTMTYFIRRTYLPGGERIFSGINHGGYDLDVFISQDGLLVDPDLVVSGLLPPKDLYDAEAYISFRINKIDVFPLDGGVICKQETYVLGCYDKPTGITPILENYGSVELTLCRQLCAVGEYNVTLIGRGYCACATDTDVNSLAPPAGTCEDACLIHEDQRCGDGSVVWAHQTVREEVGYGRYCSSLYSAGIFFKSTYILADTPSQPRQEVCGFSDTSSCAPTMLGKNGECFRFYKTPLTFEQATLDCFLHDSYLFNPMNDTLNDFVYAFTIESGLLDGLRYWHDGLIPMFYNNSYVTSSGIFVDVDLANDTYTPETQTTYDMETETWFESNEINTLPYICQTNQVYHGCQAMSDAPDASYVSQWNSMTNCIQWCNGQNMQYAATSQTNCSCYATPPTMTSAYGSCDQSCPSVATQPCGGVKPDGNMIYSVMEIASDIALASSCLDLYRYGVGQPGWYYIQTNAGSPVIRVACFGEGGPYQPVREENITLRVAQSTMLEHPPSFSSFTFPRTDVWKPLTDTPSEFVGFTLDDFQIITGVLTAGLRSRDEVSFVRSFGLSYYDSLLATMVTYSQNGSEELNPDCDDDVGMCLVYLSQPFITNQVLLHPKTWEQSISVQMTFYGQSAYQFAYSDQYIGCFLDTHDEFETTNSIVNLTDCINICEQLFFPFASIDEFDVCFCGSNGLENGRVDDADCPIHSNGSYWTGLGNRRAVYGTYEAKCEEPELPVLGNGSIASVAFPFQEGVFSYATLVNFTCDYGYEHPDATTWENSACQQNNQWTNLTQTCQKISCPSFSVVNGVVEFESFLYQGNASVTCNATFYTQNTLPSMNITCMGNKQWSVVPTCTVNNQRKRFGDFRLIANTVRSTSGVISESKSRSRLDCAGKCNTFEECKGANYIPASAPKSAGSCRLYSTEPSPGDLTTDASWEYLEIDPLGKSVVPCDDC